MTQSHHQADRLMAIDLPVAGAARPAAADHPWSRGALLLPRVSVIVSCYNYAKYIEAALDSVAGQSYRDFECVVVDDASSDNSVEIIENWLGRAADPRFRLVSKPSNGGQLSALADGLAATDGEFVAMLDADDLWLPEFLSRHVQVHLNSLAAFPASCSDLIQIDQNGHIVAGNTWWHRDLGETDRRNRHPLTEDALPRLGRDGAVWPAERGDVKILTPDLFKWHWSVTSGMVFRRSMLDLLMLEDPGQVRICADHYLMTLAHCFSGSLVLEELLGAYRRHGRNSFSTLPVLGSWAALAPGNGQGLTDRNFTVMLNHVLDRYETFRSIFGEQPVHDFLSKMSEYLTAKDLRIDAVRIDARLKVDARQKKAQGVSEPRSNRRTGWLWSRKRR